jgi:branched-chain amino acid transport system substrate-binding protein
MRRNDLLIDFFYREQNMMTKPKAMLAGAVLLAMSFQSVAAPIAHVLKIVSHTPLSGSQSTTGETIKFGVELAVQDFGSLLAPYGYKLILQPEDDQASPTVGVANANRLIGDAAIIGVIGHYNSGVSIPASEVYAKANLAMISPANTNPVVTERASTAKIANRVCGRDDVQGPAAAQFMVNHLKPKKIYVLNNKTTYGSGLAQEFEKEAKKKGINVVWSTGVDEKQNDFSSILNRAAIDKPEVIFFGGIFNQAGLLLKQMRQRHIDAYLLGGDGLDSPELQTVAGAQNMYKTYFTTVAMPLNQLPRAKTFVENYKKQFKKEPDGFSVASYDAAHAMILATAESLKAHGGKSVDRAEIAANIRKVNFEGLLGPIAFDAKGDIKMARYVVVEAGTTHDKNKTAGIITK